MKTSMIFLLALTASGLAGAADNLSEIAPLAVTGGRNPNVEYAISIARPAAAPAETASDAVLATSDAVAKARTQVERELSLLGGGASPSPSLVVPRKESDPKSMADTEEDLSVMSHILDKAASTRDEKGTRAMGISVHGYRSSAIPRSLYLEGYGALFFLNVNFPLLPPAARKDDSQPKEETNTEWENARRELFQPSSFSSDLPKFYAFDTDGAFAFSNGSAAEEYDADKVEDLKKNLVGALKNAVHIRKLGNDEMVTIIVSGRSPASDSKSTVRRSSSGTGHNPNVWVTPKISGSSNETKGTRLVLRAKKSDIESFQKDKLSLDDFRKQVTIMIY